MRAIPADESAIHRHLKEATQAIHDRVEAQLSLREWCLSFLIYRSVLQAFYGFYAPLETAMAAGAAGTALATDVTARRKAHWLEQDLSALGINQTGLASLPRCAALPPMRNEAELLGTLYVVEGATLGGRIVLQALRENLGDRAIACSRFFRSYEQDVIPQWERILALIEAHAGRHEEEDVMIASAVGTFLAFERWLMKALPREAARSSSANETV